MTLIKYIDDYIEKNKGSKMDADKEDIRAGKVINYKNVFKDLDNLENSENGDHIIYTEESKLKLAVKDALDHVTGLIYCIMVIFI